MRLFLAAITAAASATHLRVMHSSSRILDVPKTPGASDALRIMPNWTCWLNGCCRPMPCILVKSNRCCELIFRK